MNKASGGDGIPVEIYQILKDVAVKVLHSIGQQIEKTQQWPQDWKRSAFIPIPQKDNAKESSNYCTIALISDASKVMHKILQVRLQQNMNYELPNVQAGFQKSRGTREQIANTHWIIKKKTTLSASWEICMQGKNKELEPDMEQQIGYKSGKEYVRLHFVTLLI